MYFKIQTDSNNNEYLSLSVDNRRNDTYKARNAAPRQSVYKKTRVKQYKFNSYEAVHFYENQVHVHTLSNI